MLELTMSQSKLLAEVIIQAVKHRKEVTQNTAIRTKYLERVMKAEEEMNELMVVGQLLNDWIKDLKELEELEKM